MIVIFKLNICGVILLLIGIHCYITGLPAGCL
jgi:hypothetical protein